MSRDWTTTILNRQQREHVRNTSAISLLSGLSPAWLKRAVWNFKYRYANPHGRPPASAVAYIATHFGRAPRLLDVGCGPGTFLRDLREAGWVGRYTGLDISDRAIGAAKLLSDDRAKWIVGDIETFNTEECWDVICFIESIYYVPIPKLAGILHRLSEQLSPGGCIIIRVWNSARHSHHIRELSRCCSGFEIERISDTIFRMRKGTSDSGDRCD